MWRTASSGTSVHVCLLLIILIWRVYGVTLPDEQIDNLPCCYYIIYPKVRASEVLRPIPYGILGFQNRDRGCSANRPLNGTSGWFRPITLLFNRQVDYCYPTLVFEIGTAGRICTHIVRIRSPVPNSIRATAAARTANGDPETVPTHGRSVKWSSAPVTLRVSPDPKSGGLSFSLALVNGG